MRQAKLSASKTEFFEQYQATDDSVPQPAKRLLDSDGHLRDLIFHQDTLMFQH